MNKYLAHFLHTCYHKWYVFQYCAKAGIWWQGIMHDLSKFSPTEFIESGKYYDGYISPIVKCKEECGVSYAWLHHRGRNPHHWEYWVDELDEGMEAKLMPYKYAVEMLCDYLGAAKAYMGKNFSYLKELEWWYNKRKKIILHPAIDDFITICLEDIVTNEYFPSKRWLKRIYQITTSFEK